MTLWSPTRLETLKLLSDHRGQQVAESGLRAPLSHLPSSLVSFFLLSPDLIRSCHEMTWMYRCLGQFGFLGFQLPKNSGKFQKQTAVSFKLHAILSSMGRS